MASCAYCPSDLSAPTGSGWATSGTGASAGSCGGATGSLCGTSFQMSRLPALLWTAAATPTWLRGLTRRLWHLPGTGEARSALRRSDSGCSAATAPACRARLGLCGLAASQLCIRWPKLLRTWDSAAFVQSRAGANTCVIKPNVNLIH